MKREELIGASNMSPFMMYIDDSTKLSVLIKLREMGLVTKKGTLAPTIRVLLNMFAEGKLNVTSQQIEDEYLLTTKKNKRSHL